MAKLDAHKNEISRLLGDGMGQAEIIRHFAGRGVTIPKSSLYDFVRQRQKDGVALATMEDDGIAERFAAALDLQKAIADELTDRLIDLVGEVRRMQKDGEERHAEVIEALGTITIPPASTAEEIRPLLDAALVRLDSIAGRTGVAGLRWLWGKALLMTGLAWGLLVSALYYLNVARISTLGSQA